MSLKSGAADSGVLSGDLLLSWCLTGSRSKPCGSRRQDGRAIQDNEICCSGVQGNTLVVAARAWKSGKPGFGFPLFHPRAARAVGMWKSRTVGEISKGRWEEWKTCLWFSTLSTAPSFPQLLRARSSAAPAFAQQRLLGLLHPLGRFGVAQASHLSLQQRGADALL